MRKQITVYLTVMVVAMIFGASVFTALVIGLVDSENTLPLSSPYLYLGLAAVLVAELLITVLLCRHVVRRIVEPVERLAEDPEDTSVKLYRELEPVARTMREQHEEIVKNDRMRSEFTANVSHELKTPLTAISGYAELIESDMGSAEDRKHFADEIHRNSNRLLMLIDDIIRLSELDTAQIQVDMENVNLLEIAQSCVENLKTSAADHKVTLHVDGKPAHMKADRTMMEELIFNLCDNAIRYNNEGGEVFVNVSANRGVVLLSVKDTGIGIPKEHQDRIFERFYRVDKSRSKRSGGTGLGLAIVKHVAALHHGEITVDSEAGQGTEIKIAFS
ncbi:MAG: hypothetical protein J6T47_05385 [Lachnospiraceae bacterium]|nr:hypothetical protein [Lachnospiraceae bacterium]